MEYSPPNLENSSKVRLSSSPALSPTIIDPPESPVRSVHLQTMEESIHNQVDYGLRTTDFFEDDSSNDEEPNYDDRETPESSAKTGVDEDDGPVSSSNSRRMISSEYLSGHGNGEEPEEFQQSYPNATCAPGVVGQHTGGTTTNLWTKSNSLHQKATNYVSNLVDAQSYDGSTIRPREENQMLKAHTVTPRAFLHNQDDVQSEAHAASFEDTLRDSSTDINSCLKRKRVSTLPTSIEVHPNGNFPENVTRTPYPINIRKSFMRHSQLSTLSNHTKESILVLSIRRNSNRRPSRVAELKIPASLDMTPSKVSSPRTREKQSAKHFDALDFDDAHLFRELRRSYSRLSGRFRLFSARKLVRIEVSHSMDCEFRLSVACSKSVSCQQPMPKSRRLLISQGLTDPYSSENAMRYYLSPKLGRRQYMWVYWVHRMSSIPLHVLPPAPIPPSAASPLAPEMHPEEPRDEETAVTSGRSGRSDKSGECAVSLDFIEGWSAGRMATAVILVLLLSLIASLLWIFEGVSSNLLEVGYLGAGDRVAAGLLLGLFVLISGLTVIGVWLCISWLVD